ncbi:MAG: 16S rRNA methyltransferase [Acidimicrobiales bacterium mtb01]|nr:16S rRNA (uracil(1498)-N(3))-methyltransferase [Actinomycetota bacterium]TEX45501.1 MAG: 16S rRNA methyltransferase [Acidimicrobiales bacterium mtb01]
MNDRRRASAHVFVDDLDALILDSDDAHHLTRVLRLRDGERVTASDGRGRWRNCRFDGSGLVVDGAIESEASVSDGAVLFALSKGDKPETAVQKLTELGVARIVPFVAERSVVKWDESKAQRNVERLRKVAREAAMQSRQVRLPIVDDVQPSLAAAIALVGDVAVAEPGGDAIGSSVSAIAVGPEGGFTPAELDGRRLVALPGGVLRAETAAVVAGALLVDRHTR